MAVGYTPRTRQALIVSGPGRLEVASLPVPQPGPGQVLVRVASVALNPSDAKMVVAGTPAGSVGGLDFAGTVVRLGPGVEGIEIGARVCGVAFGYNAGGATGAFAEYALAEAHLVVPVAEGMALREAATLPVGLLTAGMVLFHILKLEERPSLAEDRHVLVYGASTASGLVILQVLRHSGYEPVAICSQRNFDLVRKAGATVAFDYRSESCIEDIRDETEGKLAVAVDCITTLDSMRICYSALRELTKGDDWAGDSRYVALDSFPLEGHTRRAVRPSWVFAMSGLGVAVDWTGPYRCEASAKDRAFSEGWMRHRVPSLLRAGVVKPPSRVRVVGTSLEAVPRGIELLREGNVSGEKLVCELET